MNTPWKPFWFESNQFFDTVATPDDFNRLRAAYPEHSDEQLLAAKEATYDGTRAQARRDAHPKYGYAGECDGERTLADFFVAQGMEVPPRA